MTDPLQRLTAALAGRYEILREVGAGGMATVYLAEDVKHHRKVAVKVLRPELAATLGGDRFFREIEIAAQLQHPHILPLHDSGEAEGFYFFVMPYVEGESLRERLARQGELPISEGIRILKEVVDALAYAHAHGVVHRDIKPDNVMLSGRHALVTDFGIAKAVSEASGRQKMTTAGVALGTPAYMAPEQAAADPHVDHRADIYAIGAMGYELIAGRPPFIGATPQMVLGAHVTQAPEPVTTHRAACPPALAQIIMRCLAKRPADRWQSSEELLSQLEPLATPSGGVTPTQTAPYLATASLDRWYGHPFKVGGLFLLASVAVLGVVYFLTIQLGLPDWVLPAAVGLLLLGLPIMVITGLIERRRARARSTGAVTVSGEHGLRGWFTWKRAMLGGAAAFTALGLGTVIYTVMRLFGIGPAGTLVASGKLGERDKVLVADFENRTADSTLGPSVTEAFRIDLAQSRVVSLMTPSAVGEALERMKRDPDRPLDAATAREVALREGGKGVIEGEISPVGKGYVLSAKLVTPDGGTVLVALRETADDDGAIIPAIDRLSGKLRERIGESLRTIRANEPLDQVTTNSLQALQLYSQGARASDYGDYERAIDLLNQAVTLDSGFAMAWRKLAVALNNSGSEQGPAIAAATRAYEHRDRLPELERYLTTAYYYSTVDYQPDQVIAAYRATLTVDPDQNIALNNLAGMLMQRHQFAEAEQLALRAGGSTGYPAAIEAQLMQGKVAEARATFERLAKEMPESPSVWVTQAFMAASLGAYDSAAWDFQAIREKFPTPFGQALAGGGLAVVAQVQGKLAEAERNYRQVMIVSEKRGLPGAALSAATNLASMQVTFRGDLAGAQKTIKAALQRHPVSTIPMLDRPYTDLAYFYATAGQPERAKEVLREYNANVPEPVRRSNLFRQYTDGLVSLADHRPQEAIVEFRALEEEIGCITCALYDVGRAYEQLNQPDSALASYEGAITGPGGTWRIYVHAWTLAKNYKRLGEMYEDRGNRDKAVAYYGKFVDLWKGADAELQPQVKDVKERMAKLVGEK